MDNTATSIGFEGFVLDLERGRILAPEGDEVQIRPKAFDLLVVLAQQAERPISKAELLDRVWGKVNVTEDSLFQAVKDARRAIRDAKGRILRSVKRRGYVLDCAVSLAGRPDAAPALPAPHEATSPPRPSVAVLPFQTIGDTPGRQYVTAGLVEEITIALSRFGWLHLIASGNANQVTAATHSENSDHRTAEIGRVLDVRYLVDGSVTHSSPRLLIRCRLIEAATGRQVWSDRFEGGTDDIILLYDAVTSAIAAALEPRILRAEIERVLRKGTADLDAFDCYLRALPGYYSRTPNGNTQAIGFLETALERDPHFNLARALLSRCIATSLWLGLEADYAADTARALGLAQAALAADRSDPQILALCGHLVALFGGQHDEAEALLALSLRMNPNSAEAWRLGAWVATFGGNFELSLQRLDRSERLDPLSPLQADIHSARSGALFFMHRYEGSVAAARRSLATTPEGMTPRRFMTAALHHFGREPEARQELAHLMRLQPNNSLKRERAINLYRHAWMTELLIDGLHGAGMSE